MELDINEIRVVLKPPPTTPQSHILPSIALPIPPPAQPLPLDEIRITVNLLPPESLFYSSRLLTPSEQSLTSSWLCTSLPLSTLRRTSAHLVRQLNSATDPATIESLELRAQLVAEATATRAAREAQKSTGLGRRRGEVEERRAVAEALARFEKRIADCQDEREIKLLLPVKSALQDRLRRLVATLVAYGVDGAETEREGREQVNSTPFEPGAVSFSESSLDENDCALATRENSWEEITLRVGEGYVSSEGEQPVAPVQGHVGMMGNELEAENEPMEELLF